MYMQPGKRSWTAGVLVFVGIFAAAFVVISLIRVYTDMPSKDEVINFANNIRGEVTESGIDFSGSLVPDSPVTDTVSSNEESSDPTPAASLTADWLSPEQRRLLSKLGIDEAKLPKTLTPELEACFIETIGKDRVAAIKAGDAPTVVEGMKAMTCL
ncbi:MAG: hypothetical protein RLZZ360_313 [Candidatus Parcubacteria bacterium]|jgi:hypothetical protein